MRYIITQEQITELTRLASKQTYTKNFQKTINVLAKVSVQRVKEEKKPTQEATTEEATAQNTTGN